MLLYAFTILVSAFLLFQVQPVIAKIILPWFGGSAAVWTTCLLFFQMVLLLGYLYAHAVVRYLKPRDANAGARGAAGGEPAGAAHYPSVAWKPSAPKIPPSRILRSAVRHRRAAVFSALHHRSADSGLVRAPLPRRHAVPPLCAVECRVDVRADQLPGAVRAGRSPRAQQAVMWSLGLRRRSCCCAAARRSAPATHPSRTQAREARRGAARTARHYALWLALPACASVLLLAITNHLSQNVAAIPFLWVLPLSIYLLTFILCFEGSGWYGATPTCNCWRWRWPAWP